MGHSSVEEAVSRLVHESAHANQYFRGVSTASQCEEYTAFRREFLYQTGYRPSLAKRLELWNEVKDLYPYLPEYKIPLPGR